MSLEKGLEKYAEILQKPPKVKRVLRSFRVEPTLWREARAFCAKNGKTISQMIELLLENLIIGNIQLCRVPKKIRKDWERGERPYDTTQKKDYHIVV